MSNDVRATQDLPLGAEFPAPTRDQWLGLVEKVLAGAPFDRKLVATTYDGLRIEPLYVDGDGPGPDAAGVPAAAPFTRGGTAARRVVEQWDIRQWHGRAEGEELGAVSRAILEDLNGGVTSIVLGPLGVGSVDELDAALAGVYLDLAPICLDWGVDAARGADLLGKLWERRGVVGSARVGEFGLDPLGTLARQGWLPGSVDDELATMRSVAAATVAASPAVRSVRVDASVYGDGGASDAQELAYALATGVAYLRALTAEGMAPADALTQLSFRVTATPDQFATMAKLRAARRCWARISEVAGAPEVPMHLHAITACASYSQRDPWVNLLRATLACFAAATAGADAITVLPFGAAAGRWDADGRRLARNTQVILAEESNLARVADPGGGSWYLETFTEQLAAEAWTRFQAIEAAGGMVAALTSGTVTAEVAATWDTRRANLARRKDALTGVSEFPNLDEQVPAPVGGLDAVTAAPASAAVRIERIPLRRLAAPFEALRDAADRAGTRPQVFLANLGPVAVHTARAGFAKNFFEVAGIRALGNEGFATVEEAAAAFTASGAPLAVICSSDAVYAEQAEAAAAALKAAGATRVYLAGNPGDRKAAYEAAGVDEFVFMGSDVLDVLRRALEALGITVA